MELSYWWFALAYQAHSARSGSVSSAAAHSHTVRQDWTSLQDHK